jgi:hypothetical protein
MWSPTSKCAAIWKLRKGFVKQRNYKQLKTPETTYTYMIESNRFSQQQGDLLCIYKISSGLESQNIFKNTAYQN